MRPLSGGSTGRSHVSVRGCVAAGRGVLPIALWAGLPALLTVRTLLRLGVTHTQFAGDFHYAFWPAGQHVLHGLSPYVDPGAPVIKQAIAFVYPAVGALLLVPLALLPHAVADNAFALFNLGAMLLTLRLLKVHDWRLYGLALISPAVFSGWSLANVTLLLGLGVALAWRYRERALVAGALVALLVSVKLFLWPLALWLAATRRYAALGYAALVALALNAVAWAALGFNELHRYSALMQALANAEEKRGYSLISLSLRFGASHFGAYALAILIAIVAATACIVVGRAGRDLGALALALAVSIVATPIVQLHYFALLLVPFAVARPRLSLAWALPLAFWACWTPTRSWQVAGALALGTAMLVVTLRSASSPHPARRPLAPTRRKQDAWGLA